VAYLNVLRTKHERHPQNVLVPLGLASTKKVRPRKESVLPDATHSAFEIEFEKRMTVTQGGVDQELTVEEALQRRTYRDALAGNCR
jgi:hypothetical protein